MRNSSKASLFQSKFLDYLQSATSFWHLTCIFDLIIFAMQEDLKGAHHPTLLAGRSALGQGTAEGNDLAQGITEGSGLAQGTGAGSVHAQGIAEESVHTQGIAGVACHMKGTPIEGGLGHQPATGTTKQTRQQFPSVMNSVSRTSSNCVAAVKEIIL
jgi:hypothetical protein